MDLRPLTVLIAIADHGSFSAAARALHTVQSNVSSHVARLERELQTTLVDRATGSLTAEGVAVVARARRVEAELEAMAFDVASLRDEVSGSARLGVIGTTARWLIPPLVDRLRHTHPRIHLVVVDAPTTSLLPQLASSTVDLAVVNLPVDEAEVSVEPLFDEDAVLVVPDTHALAGRSQVSLRELGDHELLLSAPGTAYRAQLDEDARDAGIELRPLAEVDGMRLLASLAFQGFGAAILPASAAPGWVGGDWKRVPVTGARGRDVGLATRRRGLLSAPARAVRQILIEVVGIEGSRQPGIHPAVPHVPGSGDRGDPATPTGRDEADAAR